MYYKEITSFLYIINIIFWQSILNWLILTRATCLIAYIMASFGENIKQKFFFYTFVANTEVTVINYNIVWLNYGANLHLALVTKLAPILSSSEVWLFAKEDWPSNASTQSLKSLFNNWFDTYILGQRIEITYF